MNRLALLIMTAATVSACAGERPLPPDPVSPMMLDVSRGQIPPPGLCRVVGAVGNQACDGILYSAPHGARVLFRPEDGTRTVEVWYLSTSTTAVIIGKDLFDIDTRRLVKVIQKYEGG